MFFFQVLNKIFLGRMIFFGLSELTFSSGWSITFPCTYPIYIIDPTKDFVWLKHNTKYIVHNSCWTRSRYQINKAYC